MTDPLTQTLVRRERLLENIARQRVELVTTVKSLSGPIAVVDRALGVGRVIRSHPLVFGAIAIAIFVILICGLALRRRLARGNESRSRDRVKAR